MRPKGRPVGLGVRLAMYLTFACGEQLGWEVIDITVAKNQSIYINR